MGNAAASPRLQRLIDLGFDEAECRYALAAADGDVDRAAALLLERRHKHGIARIVNDVLRVRIGHFWMCGPRVPSSGHFKSQLAMLVRLAP